MLYMRPILINNLNDESSFLNNMIIQASSSESLENERWKKQEEHVPLHLHYSSKSSQQTIKLLRFYSVMLKENTIYR
jgi:hypothetical protein